MPLGLISWYDRVIKLYSGSTADYSVKRLAFLRYAQSCPWNKASLSCGSAHLILTNGHAEESRFTNRILHVPSYSIE